MIFQLTDIGLANLIQLRQKTYGSRETLMQSTDWVLISIMSIAYKYGIAEA